MTRPQISFLQMTSAFPQVQLPPGPEERPMLARLLQPLDLIIDPRLPLLRPSILNPSSHNLLQGLQS